MDRETNVCFGCAGPSCSLPDATPVGTFHFRFFLHIPFERFLPRNGIVEARSSPQFRILSPSDLLCANRKGEIFSLVFSCSRLFKLASFIVLFGPTLAAMCKQCAIPVSQKAGKQRSLFDSGEVAVTSLCHSRASRLWVWLYKRETSKIACKDELDLGDALEVQLDTCP